MRSPAEALRRAWRVEGLLRGVALAALSAAIVAAFWQQRRGAGAPPAAHLEVRGAVDVAARDSLAALARAGRRVTWAGELRGVMAVAEPTREPVTAWRVAIVGDGPVALRDSLDALDSLEASGVLTTEPTRGPVQVLDGDTRALAEVGAVSPPKAVFVYGRAGWEPRFAMSALEELDWTVDARLELGRNRAVRQGAAAPSAARHGVVVVFDSAAARREAAALQRFVRAGGGVVLAGDAARSQALPARVDSLEIALGDSTVRVLARRVGRGRVLELREAETWRWRMQGAGAAVEEHRTFWSRLVGIAAPVVSDGAGGAGEAPRVTERAALTSRELARASAPRAALVHALGPQSSSPRAAARTPATLAWWLAPIILLALLCEWASRRRRGVP
jgi:hypothetical protein